MGPTGKAAGFPRRFGKYTLLSHLATGGMADVFLARQLGPGGFQKECVIKRVLPTLTQDPSNQAFVDMFLQEARIAARLSHPNIVHILDFGQIDGDFFLAMEYVDGVTLETVLEKARTTGQPALPWPIAVRIVSNAAEGLDHAHKAKDPSGAPLLLVHRDVSPSNVMVSWDGVAKVLDFGIAKAMALTTGGTKVRTGIGIIKGKVPYMSPEQIQGLDLDARSDVFSLAAVLYELTTGQRPFPGETTGKLTIEITSREPRPPEELNTSFPPDLHPILMRGLAKSVEKRYQSARDFKVDLEQFLADQHSSCSNYDVEAYLKEVVPIETRPRPEVPSDEAIASLESDPEPVTRPGGRRSDAALTPPSGLDASAARGDGPSTPRAASAGSPSTSGVVLDALEAEERRRKRDRSGGGVVMAAIGVLVLGTAVVFYLLHKRAIDQKDGQGSDRPAVVDTAGSGGAAGTPSPTPAPTPASSGANAAVTAPAAGTPAAKPADKPEEKTPEKPADKPAVAEPTKPTDKPADKPADKPVEAVAEKPASPAATGDAPKPATKSGRRGKKADKPEEGSRPGLALPPPPPADPE